jgi:hypothetical protein
VKDFTPETSSKNLEDLVIEVTITSQYVIYNVKVIFCLFRFITMLLRYIA